MKYKNEIKIIFITFILCAIFIFFYREFQRNYISIQSYKLKFNLYFISISIITILINCIINTYSWLFTLNSLSIENKLTFIESIAMVNTSNLTKYLPGKVWSYVLQTYWLTKAGFSKSLILYVYLINTFISLITFMILGITYLILTPGKFPFWGTVALLITLILLDLFFIKYNATAFNGLITIVNKLFKLDIKYFDTPLKLLFYLHSLYLVAALCFGASAYFMCFGIGFDVAARGALPVMASMIISDVIGFLAIIVPGGLGVREAVMFSILNGVSSITLALILPIATRIANMLVDVFLGMLGFILLKRITTSR